MLSALCPFPPRAEKAAAGRPGRPIRCMRISARARCARRRGQDTGWFSPVFPAFSAPFRLVRGVISDDFDLHDAHVTGRPVACLHCSDNVVLRRLGESKGEKEGGREKGSERRKDDLCCCCCFDFSLSLSLFLSVSLSVSSPPPAPPPPLPPASAVGAAAAPSHRGCRQRRGA